MKLSLSVKTDSFSLGLTLVYVKKTGPELFGLESVL